MDKSKHSEHTWFPAFSDVTVSIQQKLWFSTANFHPMKTMGTGHYEVSQVFPALFMEEGCKNHIETLCVLWVNPVIFTECGETP